MRTLMVRLCFDVAPISEARARLTELAGDAVPSFLANLEAACEFFVDHDAESATERLRKLKAELLEMIAVMSWSPVSGRPARFLTGKSVLALMHSRQLEYSAEA